jgi:hypothetical protein
MSLRIDVTAFAGVSCWLYRSRNMHELGHPEIVLALGRRDDDDARGLMKAPLELMKVLFERAQSGGRLAVGDWTELSGGLFGRDDLRGLTYLPCPPLPGLDEPSDAIVVCVLTGDELEVVKRAGAMRIAARLGQSHAYYPYPPWLDRERADVSVAGEASQTLLSRVARVGLGHATKIGETIVLCLDPHAADRVDHLAAAGDDAAVALLTLPAADATALLVWRPGQDFPSAYAGPGGDLARLGGGFCLLVGGQEHDEGQLLEDGFAVRLTPGSWASLRRAVRDRAPLDIAPVAGLGLSLRWA